VVVVFTGAGCAGEEVRVQNVNVTVEEETRDAPSGRELGYALYLPKPRPGLQGPPFPAVILTHGFLRDHTVHRDNAVHMAERGIAVLVPNMSSLWGLSAARDRNAADTADHIRWLAKRSRTPGDLLYGMIDPARIGLAGHSAGGAVSVHAAARAQQSDIMPAALCLLDAVPWRETLAVATDLQPLPLLCLRSDPSVFNAWGKVSRLMDAIEFPAFDVRIVGASHVDPENPGSRGGRWFGGVSSRGQGLYQRLTYLFFRDAFGLPPLPGEPVGFVQEVSFLAEEGAVVVKRQPD
jgi:dienelactone hydrolase